MNDRLREMLQLFESDHLPDHLREISQPFEKLAWQIAEADAERPAEQTTAIRKLLEAKDCAVRAGIPVRATDTPPQDAQPEGEDPADHIVQEK